jgi:hypothetical protein
MNQATPHEIVWYDDTGIFPTSRRLTGAQNGLIAKRNFLCFNPIQTLSEEALWALKARFAYLTLEMDEVESFSPRYLS